ncbi:site-specific integrase [Tenacibaculum singaporense]|uniref:Site-specific integrase n=1 Tax=Tenacibaculum singaporense TaxID=2358479 RepID=A0A3Q8RTH7_9FLAO|nr:site-specific integrase [Tenacibaculum singaporense]AZJ36871.1 site-specific integrase [Tenacibaculum singaporense]
MNNNRLITLFFLQKNRTNQQNICPIRCRITYNKKRKEFSTGFFINPDYWNSKEQLAKPPSKDNTFINTQLSLIKQQINQAFLFLQVNEKEFDVEDIYLQHKGKSIKSEKTFLEVFDYHNSKVKKTIGIDYVESTYKKFEECKRLMKKFIRHKYKKNDLVLQNIKFIFLEDLDYYLKTERRQSQSTINKHIQRVRKIIKLAILEGFIDKDPFVFYRPKRTTKELIFLTSEELKLIETHQLRQKKLVIVKDLFIFCCYTGLAYADMSELNTKNIQVGFDGNEWIEMSRKKTKSKISIPLLPKPRDILLKYNNKLPKISNQKFNSYLKEIADIIGINKNLTHHIARKTFASTVLLYNGVPMEVVSELLGHSKITITQEHYAKVVKKKISDEVSKLNQKLGQD